MKKIYIILALIGMLVWTAAIFLRETSLMEYSFIRRLFWVAPNFGVVWAGVGFTYILYPRIRQKEFETKNTFPLVGIILVLLFVSEIIHHFFLDSPFDIWDMVASIIAAIIIIAIYIFKKHKDEYYHFKRS